MSTVTADQSSVSKPVQLELIAVALVIVMASLMFIGLRGLWEPDEGRYTAVALEMVRTGDWLHPQLHHELPHYTKPPVTYWLLAASVSFFGRSEWSVRLPGAIAFGVTALMVGLIARRLSPRRGAIAAVIYGTSGLPFVAANIVTTDTLLAMWISVGMLGLVHAWFGSQPIQTPAKPQLRWVLLMWFGFAMAFMTKGPPGLLPLVASCLVVLCTRERRVIGRLFHPAGIALFIIVGGAWYFAVILDQPDLLRYFLYDEVYARVATDQHSRNPEWYKAFMYPALLFAGLLPWSVDWIRRKAWLHWSDLVRSRTNDAGTFLLAGWIVVPLLVFMISSSRLPLYILPLMAPLAVLTARFQSTNWLRLRTAWKAILPTLGILVAVRIGLSSVGSAKDARHAAAMINVPSEIDELVYIDLPPRLGMSFYFDREVEEVTLDPLNDSMQSLDAELEELEGTLLLILRDFNEDRVRQVIASHHWSVVRRDVVDDEVLLAIAPPVPAPNGEGGADH